MTRLLVTGGRTYNNERFVFHTLDVLHNVHVFTAVGHGQCHLGGADFLAGKWARARGIEEHRFPVQNIHDGSWPRAGNKRNVRMFRAFLPQIVVAFKGDSGTKHMFDYACAKKWLGHDVTLYDARMEPFDVLQHVL